MVTIGGNVTAVLVASAIMVQRLVELASRTSWAMRLTSANSIKIAGRRLVHHAPPATSTRNCSPGAPGVRGHPAPRQPGYPPVRHARGHPARLLPVSSPRTPRRAADNPPGLVRLGELAPFDAVERDGCWLPEHFARLAAMYGLVALGGLAGKFRGVAGASGGETRAVIAASSPCPVLDPLHLDAAVALGGEASSGRTGPTCPDRRALVTADPWKFADVIQRPWWSQLPSERAGNRARPSCRLRDRLPRSRRC